MKENMQDLYFKIFKKLLIQYHKIFWLKKLDHNGIGGLAHKLISSFLHRKQYVSVDGIQSEIESITYGVAQGSILGPFLFLLYINDLKYSVNCFQTILAF